MSTPQPTVKLSGANGNAFNIMALCKVAAKQAGWSRARIDALLADMRSGDYNHVLAVAFREFDVE